MIKSICTLLVLFSTIQIHSQSITLLKNFNPKAKELKHSLNQTRDSLLLSCENTIKKVDIFNEDYEETLIIENHKAQIALNNLPVGKFVVETTIADKVIIMDLIRYEDNKDSSSSNHTYESKEIIEGNGMMLDESLKLVKTTPKHSVEFLLTRGKAKNQNHKKQKFYWTVTKINTESGSSKTMKLVDQTTVERMILKNKIEYSSSSGRFNELMVWEVYNTSKFMEYQVSNPDFIYSIASEYFNTTPYYVTENSNQSL